MSAMAMFQQLSCLNSLVLEHADANLQSKVWKLFVRRVEPINLSSNLLSRIHLRSEFSSIVSRDIAKVFTVQATNQYGISVERVFRLTDKLKLFSPNATTDGGLPVPVGNAVGVKVEMVSLVGALATWLSLCWIISSSG
jgi:hypothetical protein